MYCNNGLWIAQSDFPQLLLPGKANRHGLITGATGTGKTVTVKVLAEAFSDAGVPVFLADIKGDLSGMSVPGQDSEDMQQRIARFGLAQYGWNYQSYPTTYWDVFGKKGIPVRATISEMGPLLLSRLMNLSDAQEGVLNIIFKIADDQGLLLLDIKDLRAVVQAVGDHASDYKTTYGNIATSSIGGIQRGLLKLESQGADMFFGEPALNIFDWMRVDANGRGMINVLNCEELFQKPDLYAAYLLWMLSELYENLPEIGDPEKPRIVFFFDEAHLLFNIDSKELMSKVEQVVRLIRSKGVGVYFITQNPADVPDAVLSQLGNKIQHALRAYTPSDQKAVRAAAQSFVVNPEFKTEEVIPQLQTGEALVSFLDQNGAPQMVQRAYILPPQSYMGILDSNLLNQAILSSDMYGKYSQMVDRESAYELLVGRTTQPPVGNAAYNYNYNDTAAQLAAYQELDPGLMAAAPAPAQAVPQAGDTWFCTNCGTQNSGNFCGNCGAPKPQDAGATPAFAQPEAPSFSQPAQAQYIQPAPQQNVYAAPIGAAIGGAPSLVASVQADQLASQTYTQKDIEKMQKEAVKQAKAQLKEEQEAEKEKNKTKTEISKAAKSIATSAGRTAANYMVRGLLGSLLKK